MIKYECDDVYIREILYTDKEALLDFKQEFDSRGERINGDGGLSRCDTFEEYMDSIKLYSSKDTVPEGKVPATQFITIRKSDERVVGIVNVRHYLNDYLVQIGGHIGDAVRASERCKGYATKQIALAIQYAKDIGIDRVLITCNANNIASEKTILKNGGVLENIIDIDDIKEKRYWIDITK